MPGLVTIVTPTFRRPQLLLRAIASVEQQTYRPIEHLIVADGPDPDVALLDGTGLVRVVELGRNWHGISHGWGAEARMAGSLLARGDFIAYCDDDNALLPNHVADLVALIEREGVDFVHSMYVSPAGNTFGNGHVRVGSIDAGMVLHRPEVMRFGHWQPAENGYESDGRTYERWVENGATHAHLPWPTYVYASQGSAL